MLLNIVKAKAENGKDIPFNISFELDNNLISARGYEFLTPISLTGTFNYKNEELILKANAQTKIKAICDDCGETFEKTLKFDFEEKFVESYNSHNQEDYIMNQTSLQIDKPAIDNLLLNIETKMLCKKSCKGLCPVCGKNKNIYSCNCENLRESLN